MAGILDQIRNTTVADLENVRSDFDDLPRGHFSAPRQTGMTRIVEGATDLVRPPVGNIRSGRVVNRPTRSEHTDHHGDTCNNPKCCPVDGPVDARSPRQIELMANLHMQLAELDPQVAAAAVEYTTRMTVQGKWTPGREGNASDWIGRMITKVRELRSLARAVPVPVAPSFDSYKDIPTGYYALVGTEGSDDIKFYRVNHHKSGRLYVNACASDERHPIRVWATRKAVLDGIRSMGWKESTALYGAKIGSCGRCHRTLTDATSRARGIGPDCWEKM